MFLNSKKVVSKTQNDACLNTDAQTTVIRFNEKTHFRYMRTKVKTTAVTDKYELGEDEKDSLGSMCARIPRTNHKISTEQVDIFRADVPFQIDFDLLQE